MAIVTTHILNSVVGSHAGGVEIELLRIASSGERTALFQGETDSDGRVGIEITNEKSDVEFELVFQTGRYFVAHGFNMTRRQIVKEVVIRFFMPDQNERYHIPLMIAPNSYSAWWSG